MLCILVQTGMPVRTRMYTHTCTHTHTHAHTFVAVNKSIWLMHWIVLSYHRSVYKRTLYTVHYLNWAKYFLGFFAYWDCDVIVKKILTK